jgi:ribosomal protein S18 acetylase RimI-like enzyme
MGSSNSGDIVVALAPPERWGAAIQLVLSVRPYIERMRLIHALWVEAPGDAHESQFAGLFEARRGQTMLGAAFVMKQPGRTALVYQPRWQAGAPRAVEALLWKRIDQFLADEHVCVAQEVLPVFAADDALRAKAAGFTIDTELVYLSCDEEMYPESPPGDELTFTPFTEADEPRLQAVMDATYEGTLDCPELNGVRSSHDIFVGYRAVEGFEPALWQLVSRGGEDVGCVLLTRHGETAAELVYLGLVPSARGRGYGSQVARYAQWLAGARGCGTLSVAVDLRNVPALRVYESVGFEEFDRRRVLIRILQDGRRTESA